MTEDKDRGRIACAYQPHTPIVLKGFNRGFISGYCSGYNSCSESNMRYGPRKGYRRYSLRRNPEPPTPLPLPALPQRINQSTSSSGPEVRSSYNQAQTGSNNLLYIVYVIGRCNLVTVVNKGFQKFNNVIIRTLKK